MRPEAPPWRVAGACWGVVGFSALMLLAIVRLSFQGASVVHHDLSALAWGALLANLFFMLYVEGYRGFQKRYAPRFGQRVAGLRHRGTALQCLLAPLYCMGFFHAPRRQLITTWALTGMIVAFIITFRLIPQPWRGILDFGVVAGLTYGLLSCWYFVVHCWQRDPSTAARLDQA